MTTPRRPAAVERGWKGGRFCQSPSGTDLRGRRPAVPRSLNSLFRRELVHACTHWSWPGVRLV